MLQRQVGAVKAVDGVHFAIKHGRDAGPGGRVRLRQVHDRPRHPAALPADRRRGHFRGQRADQAVGRRRCARCAATCRSSSRTPTPRSIPRMTVGGIVGEPLDVHDLAQGKERQERVQELLELVGLNPYFVNRYPARVLGRAAPAHRHRPRPGREARLHRLRRADLGAGRLDPGADHQPAGGPAGALRPDLPVHRPRPVAWCATSRDRVAVMYLGKIVELADRTSSTTTPDTPTRRRCSRPCRSPTP